MKTKKYMNTEILILAGFFFLTTVGILQAQRPGNDYGHRYHRPFFLDQLTEEQKVELQNLRQSLKDQDATHKEIHEAVKLKLEEWGIELPERRGPNGRRHQRILDQLTEVQKEELNMLVSGLKEDGATRKEIHQAIQEKLNEWGIHPIKEDPNHPKTKRNGGKETRSGMRHLNHPNPFNPETTIMYELDNPSQVTVSVVNMQGQLIRTLLSEYQETGQYEVQWDGQSENGETVPTGVYLYKIQAGNEVFTGRMLMMK